MSEVAVFEALKYRVEVDCHGTRRYYNADGQLHRETGPAAILADGSKFWYQNGLRHRTDGPAIIWANGASEWYQNNKRHRIDGAAIIFDDRVKQWFINGVRLSEAEFNQRVKSL